MFMKVMKNWILTWERNEQLAGDNKQEKDYE